MKTYIANVTAQNHVANFRLPEAKKPLSLTIQAGRQIEVPNCDTQPAIDAMVDQLGRYGLVNVDEVNRVGRKITFLYSTSPIPASAILKAIQRNKGILQQEGKDRRIKSAVAANEVMNTADTPIQELETSVEEVDSGGLGNDSEVIGEGVKIDNRQDGDAGAKRDAKKNNRKKP